MRNRANKIFSGIEILILIFSFLLPINKASALSTGPALEISAWIKPTGSIVSKAIITKNNEARLVTDENGKVFCQEHDGSGWNYSATSSQALTANKWQHVACQFTRGSYGRVFALIDAVMQPYGVGKNTGPNNSTSHWFIGKDESATYGEFQGYIDEPKIRNNYDAYYQKELKKDYNSGKTGMGTAEGSSVSVGESQKWMTDGLVGHWKMDESSGTTVADASGNGNTGTLTNAQETGTAEAASTTTAVYDADNASLSTTNDAYNNMILRVTGGGGCGVTTGTERTVTDYDGAGKYFTVAAFSAEADNCTFEVRHQTGGKFGNGMGFDGSNDYITAGTAPSISLTSNFSAFLWMKGVSGGNIQTMISKGGYDGSGWELSLNTAGLNNLRLDVKLNGTWVTRQGPSFPQDGQWHHTGFQIDNQYLTFYIDGVPSRQSGGTISDNTQPLAIGSNFMSGGGGFYGYVYNGVLDEIRMYNRALSPEEVRQLSEWGPGPVGHWKMDDNVSGNSKTIVDSSGNGNNGTTNYGANSSGMDCTKQGKYGGACQFDGTDDHVNVPYNEALKPKNNFSAFAWVKPNNTGNIRTIISNNDGVSGPWLFSINSNNYLRMDAAINGAWVTAIDGGLVPQDGNWHYVGFTLSNNFLVSFYIDGKPAGGSTQGMFTISNADLRIGIWASSSYDFPGLIDDVRVYNYARTQKQITEDMNAGHPFGGSPVGSPLIQYKFDVGVGGTAANSGNSGASFNGTMTPQGGGQTQTYQLWDNGGKFGKAADLDGTDDYISIPDFSY